MSVVCARVAKERRSERWSTSETVVADSARSQSDGVSSFRGAGWSGATNNVCFPFSSTLHHSSTGEDKGEGVACGVLSFAAENQQSSHSPPQQRPRSQRAKPSCITNALPPRNTNNHNTTRGDPTPVSAIVHHNHRHHNKPQPLPSPQHNRHRLRQLHATPTPDWKKEHRAALSVPTNVPPPRHERTRRRSWW